MDGRLIDRGRDHPRPARADRRRQPVGGRRQGRKALGKGKKRLGRLLPPQQARARAQRNVAHHYDLEQRALRRSSSTTTGNTAAPISPTPATASSRRRPTRRRISPPSSTSKPGQRVLDIGCGWGGMALYLHQVAGVDVLGVTLSRRAAQDRPRARRGGGRLRPCQVRADRLSPGRRHGSTGSSRSACSSMSAPRITTNSSPSAASC